MQPHMKSKFDIWGPPILFVLTVIGLAVAAEHRITVIEECQKNTTATLAMVVEKLQTLQNNQIRVVTILDQVDKRHQNEDAMK